MLKRTLTYSDNRTEATEAGVMRVFNALFDPHEAALEWDVKTSHLGAYRNETLTGIMGWWFTRYEDIGGAYLWGSTPRLIGINHAEALYALSIMQFISKRGLTQLIIESARTGRFSALEISYESSLQLET